jgi:hypothetical protein
MGHEPDLRTEPVDAVLDRVEHGFGMHFEPTTVIRKRRSVGGATDRGTWVRIERRPRSRIDGQGWNGIEAAAALEGIRQPRWIAGMSWRDAEVSAMWRADETELVAAAPVKSGGRLTVDPMLPDAWWTTLNTSLNSLAVQETTRVATPDTMTITQDGVRRTICETFGLSIGTVDEWVPAHADLNWANVTAPDCWVLDWEDWGLAPRGFDSATLWVDSLAVPTLAARAWYERRADLESKDGRLMILFNLAKVIEYGPDDPLHEPARRTAVSVIDELQLRPWTRARRASR